MQFSTPPKNWLFFLLGYVLFLELRLVLKLSNMVVVALGVIVMVILYQPLFPTL